MEYTRTTLPYIHARASVQFMSDCTAYCIHVWWEIVEGKVVPAHAIKVCRGIGGIAPFILKVSARMNPAAYWLGGWVGATDRLDVSGKNTYIIPAWIWSPNRPIGKRERDSVRQDIEVGRAYDLFSDLSHVDNKLWLPMIGTSNIWRIQLQRCLKKTLYFRKGNGTSSWKPFCSKYQKHGITKLRQIHLRDHCPQVL
jgi:hypothetical protein